MGLKFDFDKGADGAPSFDFDAMTQAEFDSLAAQFPNGDEWRNVIALVAKDAESEKALRGLVGKVMAAGFNAAKGGGSIPLLGLLL